MRFLLFFEFLCTPRFFLKITNALYCLHLKLILNCYLNIFVLLLNQPLLVISPKKKNKYKKQKITDGRDFLLYLSKNLSNVILALWQKTFIVCTLEYFIKPLSRILSMVIFHRLTPYRESLFFCKFIKSF